jgi:hypothetical protein
MDPRTSIVASLIVLAALAALLTGIVTGRWRRNRRDAELYWSVGLALVTVTLGQEAAVYAGVVSSFMLQSYFFLVALLVGVLSLGSASLALSAPLRSAYAAYILAMCGVTAVVAFAFPVDGSVVTQGVITGSPGLALTVASSLVTFPAAVLMAVTSLYGAFRGKRWNLLYIGIGIIVISAAGSLYIASFPAALYYAEFVGVVLLFLGFVQLSSPAPRPQLGSLPGTGTA